MMSARAFAPGNISGVFKIIADDDPAKMHSLGLGLTVVDGVSVVVSSAPCSTVSFNGENVDFPTVTMLARRLYGEPLHVEIESRLPLSSGFGLSGASTLATAYAVNCLRAQPCASEELAMQAHIAEVENLTGLGDVCAQYHGGCLVKLTPGVPLDAQRLAVSDQPIYFRYFAPISTKQVLSDKRRRVQVNGAADLALSELAKLTNNRQVDLRECIRISKQFAHDSGLLQNDQVVDTIAAIERAGGTASMIMLGEAVFSTIPFEGATETMFSVARARVLG